MTDAPQKPHLAPRLYRQAAEALAAEIASGTMPGGSRLTQAGLARRFGISRAPARLTLDDLALRGLVIRDAEGRYLVRGPGAERAPAPRDTPLTPRSSWEILYPQIELAIVARASIGTWRLNEAALARHCGTSRTVARDVIARLQQRGIIRKDDSSRWLVPALTQQSLDELYELRWLLEPVAMEKAVPRLPLGLLERMQAELEAAMARDAHPDGTLLDRLEHRLHVELLSHSGHDALMRAISLPQSLLVAHHYLYQVTLNLFGTEPFLAEHLEILRYLRKGDLASAKAALVAHLRISRRRAMLRIEAVRDMPPPEPLSWMEPL
ncbi:MAG: GntR family transcriptional regulator [Paracoccus sp. (in: a-proteobacteria)]|uniref:GntR family transcriptional regulator n=1 Tax=Paracoccus sp. TaxID=267 RepID=UPI0039E62EF5